jgi:hypothetical protein
MREYSGDEVRPKGQQDLKRGTSPRKNTMSTMRPGAEAVLVPSRTRPGPGCHVAT